MLTIERCVFCTIQNIFKLLIAKRVRSAINLKQNKPFSRTTFFSQCLSSLRGMYLHKLTTPLKEFLTFTIFDWI